MMRRVSICTMALVTGLLVGCFDPGQMTREHKARGMIVLLPGVEGTTISMRGMVLGLRDAGVDCAIDLVRWGVAPLGTLENLCDLPRNQRQARKIAERIEAYRHEYPQRPVTLIGYSGGGGVAILTAESLPDGVILDRVILIGPALSPGYDLSAALSHTKHMVHFYSRVDWAQLGVGTKTFGTIDRKYVESAGRWGFTDEHGKLLKNEKLEQIAWRPAWQQLGHGGDHLGWLARNWARDVLAKQVETSLGIQQQ